MNIQEEMNEEIEKKIEAMEQTDYMFPKRFTTKDYIIVTIVIIVCFIFILYGSILQGIKMNEKQIEKEGSLGNFIDSKRELTRFNFPCSYFEAI